MRPGFRSPAPAAAAAASASFWRWNSPLPYLFGGLAVMMGLIAIALIILLCSNRKSLSAGGSSSSPNHDGAGGAPVPLDMEPRIVVIMAGDAIPSFLAKAIPSAPQPIQQ